MSKREPQLYLSDIITSIENIQAYIKNITFESFEKDQKTIDAVIRNLEIIGEAARNISPEFSEKHLEVPWKEMVSMRNKVLHEYFGVDTEILWQTITEDLSQLKEKIKMLL